MTGLRDTFDHTYDKGGYPYVKWSQVGDRLDEAVPEEWSFSIMAIGTDWVHGRLTIGERYFENIGYAENIDAQWKKEGLKDAVSDAFKRCAALAGVARYLYETDAPTRPQNGHSAPTPRPAPVRSSTAVPDDLDVLDWDDLYPTPPDPRQPAPKGPVPPVAVATRAEGTMWSKELFERAESAGVEKKTISDTAKKMFGRDKWKVTELTDGERFALAVELELA